MTLFHSGSRLSDLLLRAPEAISVALRFGIRLGVGDGSVESACRAHNVEPALFLAIVNTLVNAEYFPITELKRLSAASLAHYISSTDQYYWHVQIPNIERHFDSLLSRSAGMCNNLDLLRSFFAELKTEMGERIASDRALITHVHEGNSIGSIESADIECMNLRDQTIEEKLSDLLNFFVIHLSGEYDPNLCHAVITALFMLDRDVKQNNRIRRRLFFPLISQILKS